jgi:thioredoxin 1
MSVLHVTKELFENQLLTADKHVLLDFFATWCGPCQMMTPIITEIAEEYSDILVGKIDVDEVPSLAAKFGITSIPTLIVLEKGKAIAQKVGYCPKAQVLQMLGK